MKIVAILMVSMTYLAVCRSDVSFLNVNDKGNETSIKEALLVEETETDNYLVQDMKKVFDNQTKTLESPMDEKTNKTCITIDAICMKVDTSINENLAPNQVGMKEREAMIRFFGGPNINETEKRSLNESIFFSENGNQSLICIVPPEEAGIIYIPPHFKCEACKPYTYVQLFGIGCLVVLVFFVVVVIIICIVEKCGADLSKQPKHQALISGDAKNAPTKMP